MRLRFFPNASRLGFGCASLGSRVGRVKGLQEYFWGIAAFFHR